MTKYLFFLVGSLGKRSRSITPFLAQRIFETLQYCDAYEWRKLTLVSQSSSESYSHSVNSGGGYDYEHIAWMLKWMLSSQCINQIYKNLVMRLLCGTEGTFVYAVQK